ncbi:MAG TPA: DUF401 family protein, partial [Candidatus Desulfofervidus auxilii]|nr:DUF401 family protein [Candidatus Desulfofervidus auxilii]
MPLLKLIFLFSLLVFLLQRQLLLGHAMFLATILCGLMQGMNLFQIILSMIKAMRFKQNLLLIWVILSILVFAHSMAKTGYINRLISAFHGIFPWPRFNLMALPTLIGLLPMPGGAIFSAPFVEGLATPYQIPREQQAIINYWFRHCWEYSWPLYPGLILTIHLGQVKLFELITIDLPIVVFSFFIGYLSFLHSIKKADKLSLKRNPLLFLKEVAPIIVVIILASSGEAIFYFIPKELPIALAVWFGIIWIWIKERITFSQLTQILKDKIFLKVLYAVIGIFSFKQILIDSQIIFAANKMLTFYHIPPVLICIFLPFIVGLIIGLTLAFVGSTFPLLFALLQAAHIPVLPYVMLAYCCGIIGVLLSPMHLCLILSIEYFHVEFHKTYKK